MNSWYIYKNDYKLDTHAMLFQLCSSLYLEYFLKMPLHDIKSHKPLQLLWWRQFSKIADHSGLTIEQRAEVVVLFAEMNSFTAK